MPRRPQLSDTSFLGYIFSPKKNPKPSGLRKIHLSGTKGGRNKGRLAAFNRMSPASQELLKRAGLREEYLRGQASLGQAKGILREEGVRLGVARPSRTSTNRPYQSYTSRTSLDIRVAAHLKSVIRSADKPLNTFTVDRNAPLIPVNDLSDVLGWDYSQVKYAGRPASEYELVVEGKRVNPFWYH